MSELTQSSRQEPYIFDYRLSTQIPRIPTVTPQTPMPGMDYSIYPTSPAYTGQGVRIPSEGFWGNQGSDYSSIGSYGKGFGGGGGGYGGGGGIGPGGPGDNDFAFNIPTGKLVLGGLESFGKLWTGFQGAKLAKKSFEHTRDITNANLNNQISSYNTALEDRARARYVGEGRGEGSAAEREYVERNRLSR